MNRFLRVSWAVFRKDLVQEFRDREILLTVGLFSFLMVVVFAFAFLGNTSQARDIGPGVLWVTVLFSATLGQNRLFDRERETGCFFAMLLSPAPAAALYLSKAAGHFCLSAVMEAIPILLLLLFLDLSVSDPLSFLAGLALGTAAMSLVGTLFAAMLMNARMKEVLLPLVTFPVLVPVVIGGVKVTAASLGAGLADDGVSWLGFLAGFDAVCTGVSVWLFERMARS